MSRVLEAIKDEMYTMHLKEIGNLDYETELEGSNEDYAIRLVLINGDGDNPMAMYGVFNRNTGVRETETRQLNAARTWAEALQRVLNGDELPGLGPVDLGSDAIN